MKNNLVSLLIATVFIAATTFALQAQKPGTTVPQVNLTITIDDSVSATAGIRSDGAGVYSDGINGVAARFLTTGVFDFKTGMRQLSALYSVPVEPLAALPAADTQSNSTMLTFVHAGLFLQTMAVGSSRCEGLVVGIPFSADYTRYIGYRAGHGVLTDLAYVLVNRVDADTWTMDSQDSGCSSDANIARINDAANKGKSNDITHGRYFMPLRMTLTRKP